MSPTASADLSARGHAEVAEGATRTAFVLLPVAIECCGVGDATTVRGAPAHYYSTYGLIQSIVR